MLTYQLTGPFIHLLNHYICLYDLHTLLVQIHGHMGGQVYHGPMGQAQDRDAQRGARCEGGRVSGLSSTRRT